MAGAKNTRAIKAHAAVHRPTPCPVTLESAARILSAVRLRCPESPERRTR